MKKGIYLFLALIIIACSDDSNSDDDCGCVKTSYRGYFATSSSNSYTVETLGTENVVCQTAEVRVITQDNSGGGDNDNLYYIICCDNLEGICDILSSCDYDINTLDVTNITPLNATLNGTINIEDSENCETFPYQGFVYAKTIQPTINDTQVNVNGTDITTTLENLEPNTTYYVRTFLTNSTDEFYGNEVSFTTVGCEVVYLDSNGTTVKAYECAEVGETGVINGVTYTLVDEAMLREMVANEEDVTKAVTTRVTDMSLIFNGEVTSFNQDISNWDVSNVTDMSNMFIYANAFNQDISSWDLSNVTDMNGMFAYATAFNQPIGNWNMSNVGNTYAMFLGASSFNQPIGSWDVSSVLDMYGMFYEATVFNQDISNWNINAVNDMEVMFWDAESFNQDLSSWNVDGVSICFNFSTGATSWILPKPPFTYCDSN